MGKLKCKQYLSFSCMPLMFLLGFFLFSLSVLVSFLFTETCRFSKFNSFLPNVLSK